MFISLSPQRREDTLTLVKAGDALTVNGETHEDPAGATVLFVADRAHGYAACEEC